MTDTLDDDDMLAAEYAIGLLTGEAFEAARARMASDPAFAARRPAVTRPACGSAGGALAQAVP